MDDQRVDREGGEELGGRRAKSRFYVKRLFLSATLLCAAIGIFVCADKYIPIGDLDLIPFALVLFAVYGVCGALTGAAILLPFNLASKGAVIGLIIPGLIVLWIVVNYLLHPAIG